VGVEDIAWFRPDGEMMSDDDWNSGFARSVGVFLSGRGIATPGARGERIVDDDFILLFNAHDEDLEWQLPARDWAAAWNVEIDTNEPDRDRDEVLKPGATLVVAARSVVVLRAPQDA
jgi:glycogen operon protein